MEFMGECPSRMVEDARLYGTCISISAERACGGALNNFSEKHECVYL